MFNKISACVVFLHSWVARNRLCLICYTFEGVWYVALLLEWCVMCKQHPIQIAAGFVSTLFCSFECPCFLLGEPSRCITHSTPPAYLGSEAVLQNISLALEKQICGCLWGSICTKGYGCNHTCIGCTVCIVPHGCIAVQPWNAINIALHYQAIVGFFQKRQILRRHRRLSLFIDVYLCFFIFLHSWGSFLAVLLCNFLHFCHWVFVNFTH